MEQISGTPEQEPRSERKVEVSEPLIVDSGRMARLVTMAASKAGPVLVGLCAVLALVALIKWPDDSFEDGRASLLDRYARRRLLADIARHVEAGDADGAASLWLPLLSRERNNLAALRSFFDQDEKLDGALVERMPNRESSIGLLVRMGATNRDDLIRVIRMRARRMEWDRVADVATQMATNLSSEVKGLVALAHLAHGDVLAFDQEWSEAGAALESEPAMKPWRLAASVLLRDGADSARAKSELTAMRVKEKDSTVVLDSLLHVAFQAGDIEGHRALLEAQRIKGRRLLKHWMDHVDLLARIDDANGINDILDGLPVDRADPEDAENAARRLMHLGLNQHVLRLTDRRQRTDQSSGNLSALAAFAALVSEDWERCNGISIGMQKITAADDNLMVISHFLRGCAALGVANEVAASASFDRMSVGNSKDPVGLLELLVDGVRPGVGSLNPPSLRQAWLVARDLEGLIGDTGAYWRTRSELAGYASQSSDMSLAARTAMQVDPGAAASVATMTRALLLAPEVKPEVVSLSARLMKETPVLAEWRILRARALVAANQVAEGKATLNALKPSAMPAGLIPSANVAWLEIHVAEQDWDGARKSLAAIRVQRLEPLLRSKVERLAAKIPKIPKK